MNFIRSLKHKGILFLLLLLAPLSALADGHNMDGLVFYFFIIAALLFIPLVLLTIVAGVYSSRPKKKTLQLYWVILIMNILFYLILGIVNYDFFEDLSKYMYVPILLFIFIALINGMLIRSGYLSHEESVVGMGQAVQKTSMDARRIDQRIFTFVLIYFFLYFLSAGITFFYPDWFRSDLKFFVFSLYFLNSLSFVLLLSVLENRSLKIAAFVVWFTYTAIQIAEYLKFLSL